MKVSCMFIVTLYIFNKLVKIRKSGYIRREYKHVRCKNFVVNKKRS